MGHMPGDFIDFAHFRNLIENKEYEQTYEFNLMLVGESGLGKSALVKSLFKGRIKPRENNQDSNICVYSELLEENCVKMRVVCIEARNFDPHKNDDYVEYIDEQFKAQVIAQLRQPQWKISDTLVHCCLYLIPPYGHMKLTEKDLECMKALHERVNLVPVLAKADCFDTEQLKKFKENIIADLQSNGIKYFEFKFDIEEDEDTHKIVEKYASKFPFAIVTADEPTIVNDSSGSQKKKVKWVRKTTAGEIDILDEQKSDFGILSKLLLRHCILDLVDATREKHFANFEASLLEMKNRRRILEDFGLTKHEIQLYEWMKIPSAVPPENLYNMERRRDKLTRELEELKVKQRHLEIMSNRVRCRD